MGHEVPFGFWIFFAGIIILLLGVDLAATRKVRSGIGHAYIRVFVFVGAGLLFCLPVWRFLGTIPAQEYLAAFLLEKSLSLDNLIVFLIIFRSLRIPEHFQHKVLFWGILGAVVFRGVFIFLGAAAIHRFNWVAQIFGLVLLYAAVRTVYEPPAAQRRSRIVEWLWAHLPVTNEIESGRFVIRKKGGAQVTPLFVAMAGLELTDIVFAIDSIPVAFSVSREPFIVYTSNIFAILGLRSLYSAVAHSLVRIRYLRHGLAALLLFAGGKLILSPWYHIRASLSVFVVVFVIAVTMGVSLWARRNPKSDNDDGRQ